MLAVALSVMPTVFAEEEAMHPIIKEVVESESYYVCGDNYFAIGENIYGADGELVASLLLREGEEVYSVGDNAVITTCVELISEEEFSLSFGIYAIKDGEVVMRAELDGDEYLVLPYEYDGEYTTIVDADILSGDDPESIRYSVLDSSGDVVYTSEAGCVGAYFGNGMFGESPVSEELISGDSLMVLEDGKMTVVATGYSFVEPTEYGDFYTIDPETLLFGIVSHTGRQILDNEYEIITATAGFYIACNGYDEELFSYTDSHVFDQDGNEVYTSTDELVYYNGQISIEYDASDMIYYMYDVQTGELIDKTEDADSDDSYHYFTDYSEEDGLSGRVYLNDGTLVDGNIVFVNEDLGDHTFTGYSDDAVWNRYDESGRILESYGSEVGYLMAGYGGVCIGEYYDEAVDSFSYELMYRGAAISKKHMQYDGYTVFEGCEVYAFADGEDFVYYVISGRSPFMDVAERNWAFPYIAECYNAGIMNGTGGGLFSPAADVSRAQVVTTLWRLAGEPAPEGEGVLFDDVENGRWYSDAVAWAASVGVVNGVGDGSFAPTRAITRGEVAAIFYRYAKLVGEDVTAEADLTAFADEGELKSWNRDAFAWCVERGIINGKSVGAGAPVRLAPNDILSRAEIAAIICRYGISM